ncbi:hypothetical protein LAV60_15445 [Clostridium sporogenes]|uniref:hypothetical protein n=1 Tax=Clostridium sporogenes TaxID=1509 RepID=UPI0022372F6F|nr:hypothetical protein [Clostridium sporogenes]MCW6094565.1 hypothetical protein [Clostridium sporogenes]
MEMNKDIMEVFRSVLKEELKPIKDNIDYLKEGQNRLEKLITELDPKNANRHVELNNKIDTIGKDVKDIKEDIKKLAVVTGQNCIEIEYIKAVK